jgi:hypothetical protein
MKQIISILILCVTCIAARAEVGILWQDYSVSDEVVRPVTVGLGFQRTNKLGMSATLVTSMCCMTYDDYLRFEVGVTTTFDDKLRFHALTGISVPMDDRLTFGVYACPFWNLYGDNPDDPWGAYFGWRF